MTSNIQRTSLCITLAGALAVPPGCAIDEAHPDVSDAERSYSGEELFLGVFFVDGPAAELFPEIAEDVQRRAKKKITDEEREEAEQLLADLPAPNELTGREREKLDEVEAAVIASIQEADPTFFERFAADMQSGDHFLVDAALSEGAHHLQDALAAYFGVDPSELAADPNQPRCFSCGFFVVFAVVAAYAYAYVAAVDHYWVFEY